jgi:hypothetical protein
MKTSKIFLFAFTVAEYSENNSALSVTLLICECWLGRSSEPTLHGGRFELVAAAISLCVVNDTHWQFMKSI